MVVEAAFALAREGGMEKVLEKDIAAKLVVFGVGAMADREKIKPLVACVTGQSGECEAGHMSQSSIERTVNTI